MNTAERQEWQAAGWAIFAALCVAATGALTHALNSVASWQLMAVIRTALVTAFAWVLVRQAGLQLPWHAPKSLWMRSLGGAGGTLCCFYVWANLPLADAVTLVNTSPLWVAAVSGLFLNERTGWGVWVAVVLGLVGVIWVQQPHLDSGNNFGVGVALLGGLMSALAMVGLRRVKKLDARVVVLHMSAISLVASVAVLVQGGAQAMRFDIRGAIAAIGLVCLGVTASIGQLAITKAYSLGRAARNSVLGLMQIVFAAVFDVVFWNRHFDVSTLCGMALIIVPSAWLMVASAKQSNEKGSAPEGTLPFNNDPV